MDDDEKMCYNHDESLTPEEAESLETEFRNLVAEFQPRIREKLDAAHKLLREAEQISNESGVPFHASFIGAQNGYVPKKAADKFSNLDPEMVADLTNVYGSDYGGVFEYDGWVHSQFCY